MGSCFRLVEKARGTLISQAFEQVDLSKRKVPLKSIVVGLQGEILSEEWV